MVVVRAAVSVVAGQKTAVTASMATRFFIADIMVKAVPFVTLESLQSDYFYGT